MIRVVFLIRSLGLGGAERQLVNLVKALDPNCFCTTVLCFYHGGPLERELNEAGIEVITLGKKSRWSSGFMWRLASELRRLKPEILHGYMGTANILSVFLKPFLRTQRIVWGVRASNVDHTRYDWLSRAIFYLECFFSRYADLIIVNSNAGLEYHSSHGFPKEKMVVIPNGIDTARFYPDSMARRSVRKEWGISESKKLIGLVARLDAMKDHPTFLKAAAALATEREDVHFVCVGDGPSGYRHELHALSSQLGLTNRLIWAGKRMDMPAVYNALDVASSTSYGEGFSNAIGEAMACGIPCVVTNVGDSAWIVGETGVVVAPKNPEALATGWRLCLARNKNDLGHRARLRIIENFSIEILIKRTVEAFC